MDTVQSAHSDDGGRANRKEDSGAGQETAYIYKDKISFIRNSINISTANGGG